VRWRWAVDVPGTPAVWLLGEIRPGILGEARRRKLQARPGILGEARRRDGHHARRVLGEIRRWDFVGAGDASDEAKEQERHDHRCQHARAERSHLSLPTLSAPTAASILPQSRQLE